MKNAAAVALGRKGGKKGGLARAARMTPEERSESARNAVKARWSKTKARTTTEKSSVNAVRKPKKAETSDATLISLLAQIKTTSDLNEVRRLSDQIERVIFHKQFVNA